MTLQAYLASLQGKRVTVMGIGVSNRPLLNLLAGSGAIITARDKKTREQLGDLAGDLEAMGIKLVLGEQYLEGVEADVVFRTPGMRPDVPALVQAKKSGAEITSEMEVFLQVCPCPIIAVTGSDGKTTTTSVIAEMLRASGKTVWVGGNIGTPLLDQADKMQPTDRVVLELSSFQLMSMQQSPAVAVITNLSPNHLDWHTGMEEYVEAKCNLFRHQDESGIVVLNRDNLESWALADTAPGKVRRFSRQNGSAEGAALLDGVLCLNGKPVVAAKEIRIPGVHNVENYLAAMAALDGQVAHEDMARVAREFAGVEHRIEFVREISGVRWYNDSIGSSPSRTLAGLASFDQPLLLIAGGYDKKIPFDELGRAIPGKVKHLLLCGVTADKIEAAVKAAPDYAPDKPYIHRFDNLTDTVQAAAKLAEAGDVVLFSPACASFDQFPNFMIRGRFFKDRVNELTQEN